MHGTSARLIPFFFAVFSVFAFSCILTIGCYNSVSGHMHGKDTPEEVTLSREFKLRFGQQVALKGEGLLIKFSSVTNESRCPVGVTCVWEGNAEVILEVSKGDGKATSIKLNTNPKGRFVKEEKYRKYSIRLVGLDPYPRANSKLKTSDYVVTLLVKKD